MSKKDDFELWLINTNRSRSATKYSNALNTISNEMIGKGLINKNIYLLDNCSEVNELEEKYLSVEEYRNKNMRGNNMYSAALRKYVEFNNISYKTIRTIPEKDIGIIENKLESITSTEKDAVVKVRIGQSLFKTGLLQKYKKCIMCNIDLPNLLIASHIKPWFESNNREKVDLENGLLLCAGHDKLFDSGFISFDQNGKIMISNKVPEKMYKDLNIDRKSLLSGLDQKK